jgi:hypothetical protein
VPGRLAKSAVDDRVGNDAFLHQRAAGERRRRLC